MMWLFAILIVLAMGGVAMLAAGKGAPLAEAYDDRPDAIVPATGPLGAEDLRRVRFSLALRGYRMSEVDALLDRLAAERETDLHTGPDTGRAPVWGPGEPPVTPEGRGGGPTA
jgi:DivIVA domain-containing protein